MNFKAHLTGGVITATAVTSLSYILLGGRDNPISYTEVLFFSCLFMSLFPDLDTASIPQRYFYTSLLVIIPYTYLKLPPDYLFVLSMLSVLPLVHKHRGWTHWKITPVLISLILLVFYDRSKGVYEISEKSLLINYSMFTLSIISGHYTHLLLDSKLIKIFKNSKDHH
jgi:hypothetical protein